MNADVTKIRQILLNLLSNSAKFTKEGTISISIEDSESQKRCNRFYHFRYRNRNDKRPSG